MCAFTGVIYTVHSGLLRTRGPLHACLRVGRRVCARHHYLGTGDFLELVEQHAVVVGLEHVSAQPAVDDGAAVDEQIWGL